MVAKGGQTLVVGCAGDNPAIALLSILGNSSPSTAVINEMTAVASVWTHQFIDGTAIKGHALGLKIAASNVPSFVDLQGYINLMGYAEFADSDRPTGWNTWLTFVISPAAAPPPPVSRMITK